MSQIVSPYALLKASKPRQPHTMTTTYDLYSAVHASADKNVQTQAPALAAEEYAGPENMFQARTSSAAIRSVKKTHYISDIQNRHNAAIRRAKPF